MRIARLPALLLLSVLVISLTIASCIFEPQPEKDKEQVDNPSEPPDDPPPPPPPPPESLLIATASGLSLEAVAKDVIGGLYGPQLQKLLADEVSACVNLLSESSMVSIHRLGDEIRLMRHDRGPGSVTYSDGYLVGNILEGRYGDEARNNLRIFIRSFEDEKRVP